jgi:hypothetical protein
MQYPYLVAKNSQALEQNRSKSVASNKWPTSFMKIKAIEEKFFLTQRAHNMNFNFKLSMNFGLFKIVKE